MTNSRTGLARHECNSWAFTGQFHGARTDDNGLLDLENENEKEGGREGSREGGREGGREGERASERASQREREGERERDLESAREGGRKREGERVGVREGGREGGREGEGGGERERREGLTSPHPRHRPDNIRCGRRFLEVFLVNRYTGTWPRDSVQEFFYYLCWGLLNGACASTEVLSTGMASAALTGLGLALFAAGQAGNAYCHLVLRHLRKEGETKYVIPAQFPFNYIAAPHYFFELVGWAGYACVAGASLGSLAIVALSTGILAIWGAERHEKYKKMWRDLSEPDRATTPDPRGRWIIVPFLY